MLRRYNSRFILMVMVLGTTLWPHSVSVQVSGVRPGSREGFPRNGTPPSDASGEQAREGKPPSGSLWISRRPEGRYALVSFTPLGGADHESKMSGENLRVLFCPTGSASWEAYAEVPKALGALVGAAIPTADGRLFLVPNGAFLPTSDGSVWAPFLILGKDLAGHWNQCEPVFLEWGPPFKSQMDSKGRLSWRLVSQKYLFLASARSEAPRISDRLFEFSDGWAFLDRHHGLIWVFDGKGKLQRRISIYDDLKEADLDQPLNEFPVAVLACATTPEGRLVLAARNQIAFFFSRLAWPTSGQGVPARDVVWRETQAAKDFPNIAWFEVDLHTGAVNSLRAPNGLPARYTFRPEDPNWHFDIAIGRDGSIRLADDSGKETADFQH